MKKHVALILSAVIFLTACQNSVEGGSSLSTEDAPTTTIDESNEQSAPEQTTATSSAQSTTAQTTAQTASTEPIEDTPQPSGAIWQGELPTMDGSTSAIPLETGIKSKLLGIPWSEAGELVEHHKTHISFGNLLDGTVDLIFSVPISEEQAALAEERGIELSFTPVAKEGFVFCVNAGNPVDSLSMQQIRDIYSGKITNWKELGGEDEPIVPFQRNKNSGSQNYMTEFMDGTPLAEAPSEYVFGEMGSILNQLSSYDNGKGAIGYSVYSYAAQMYADANKIKLVAVDGIKPTKQTMADDSYPLSSCTYIITTESADENTLKFTEWAASDEGQLCVLECGYLPVNGMEIPEEYLPYEAVGTGIKKPDDYKPSEKYQFYWGSYPLNILADKDFEAEINAEVDAAIEKLRAKYPEASLSPSVKFYNGYLQILVGVFDYWEFSGVEYSDCYSFVYDVINKKKIEKFSDLFYEGENFLPLVNAVIQNVANSYGEWSDRTKADFAGYTGEPECFGYDFIILNEGNIYFPARFYADLSDGVEGEKIKDMMPVYQYRDMRECFTYTSEIYEHNVFQYYTGYVDIGEKRYQRVVFSRFLSDEEVAEKNEIWKNAQDAYYEFFKNPPAGFYKSEGLRLSEISPRYITIDMSPIEWTPYNACYDIEKGKIVTPEDIFGEEWEDLLPEKVDYSLAWIANTAIWESSNNTVWVMGNVDGKCKELAKIELTPGQIEELQ